MVISEVTLFYLFILGGCFLGIFVLFVFLVREWLLLSLSLFL